MRIMRYAALFFCLFFLREIIAQETIGWEDFVERMSDDDATDDGGNELFERLYEIYCHPINLNRTTKEQLLDLPFLSEEQTIGLLAYIKENGPMLSLGELMLVEELDADTRAYLRLFCYAGEGKPERKRPEKAERKVKHELVARTDMPLYRKAGFRDYPDEVLSKSPNKVYLGDKFHHVMRYRMSVASRLDVGLQIEKDAGEKGVDYIGGYVMLHDVGILKCAAIGDYRISFGQGLVVNMGSSFGKMMTLSSLERMDRGVYRHSSAAETGYFTGAAATLRLDNVLVTAFVSRRNEDGTMRTDSSGISSIKTDGLHRTRLERSKKGNLGKTTFGGNVHIDCGSFQFSVTGVHTSYSVPLLPQCDTPNTLYRLYNATGTEFSAFSGAYAYINQRLAVKGETAVCPHGGFATINTARFNIGDLNSLTLIQRYYGAKYVSVNGHSFGDNVHPQNECGVYIGWSSSMLRKVKLEAYADIAHYPWLKYRVSESSNAFEGMAQAEYRPNKRSSLALRYRIRSKQTDFTYNKADGLTELRFATSHALRLQYITEINKCLSLKTTLSGVMKQNADNTSDAGFLISGNLRWASENRGTRMALALTYFDTDNYNSRISIYEPTLLYSYGFSSFFYHGMRMALLATVPITKNLSVMAKIGHTRYFNRSTIGTGLDLISTNHREDISVQFRWRLH